MATAVIYARVSSTGDRQSNDRQVQDLKNSEGKELTVEGVLMTKLDNRNLFGYKQ